MGAYLLYHPDASAGTPGGGLASAVHPTTRIPRAA
jgi:hypothetical protein